MINVLRSRRVKKKNKVSRSILDILPFVKMDDYIHLKNGCLQVFEIESKDIFSMSESQVNSSIFDFQIFLRAYSSDFKLVVMDFPVNTKNQQEFIEYKLMNCKNELYAKFLIDRLDELRDLESNSRNTEYFVFIFGKDEVSLKENIASFNRLFKNVSNVYDVEYNKKEKIIYRLNNMNSKA